MRKPAGVPALAAITIIEFARNAIASMVPVARVRHRLELGLCVTQQRNLVVRVRNVVIVVARAYQRERLAKRVFRLGRAGVLAQDRLEVCPPSRVSVSALRASVAGEARK